MKEKRLDILKKLANNELTPEMADEQLLNLSVVLIEQLDEWIEDCQTQADGFLKRGMNVSETSSLSMKVAYMNVKTLVENNS